MTRRGIAIHEAGHAVASAVFKRPFSFVTIERFGRLLGHLELRRGEPLPPSEEAIATWAGSVAQALLAASNVVDNRQPRRLRLHRAAGQHHRRQ